MIERAIGFRKRRASGVSVLCLVMVAASCVGLGCANGQGGDGPVSNTIQFRLDFGGGVTLDSVDYVLTGPNGFRRIGTLPVGSDPTVTATFQNLPPGQGYNLRVRGTATDDTSQCQGEVTFDVTSSMTATLQVPLSCSGLITITAGALNICPVIDELSAVPAEVQVGASIQVTAVVHDADSGPQPLSSTWATTGGALSNLSTSGATFTCTDAGSFTVGLKISDGDNASKCPDTAKITLVCTSGPV